MAYMRGEPYVWSDGEFLHIWSQEGKDHCKEVEPYAGNSSASGVKLHGEAANELAVMLVAEMILAGSFTETVQRTIGAWGENFGSSAVVELGPAMIAAFAQLRQSMT